MERRCTTSGVASLQTYRLNQGPPGDDAESAVQSGCYKSWMTFDGAFSTSRTDIYPTPTYSLCIDRRTSSPKMPFASRQPRLDIPATDLLTYLFTPQKTSSTTPLWIDAYNPEKSLSPKQALGWAKRLAFGLDRLGVQQQDAVVIFTPNQIIVPVAYFGIVGSRRIFSGINPSYTESGEFL